MREACCLWLSAADRARLAAVVADRNSPQKHVWRAQDRPALGRPARHGCDHAPDGQGQAQRLALAGALPGGRGRRAVARQDQARAHPPAGDRSGRTGGRRTLEPPPGEATHWTVRAMARETGISPASVQRIWVAHGLQPHRVRTFKLSKDPAFASQAARRGRALRRPAGAQPRAVGRREKPDPGARPHPAGPADEEGPSRDDDPSMHGPRSARAFCSGPAEKSVAAIYPALTAA